MTIAIIVLAAIAAVLGIFHRATCLVVRNLMVKSYDLPKSDAWNGGDVYLNVKYSDVSEADYLDLYVPACEEKPQLFVIIHGGGFIAGDAETKQAQLMYCYFRDKGYACASVNYRLAQEAPFPAAIEDCKAAIRYLRANAGKYGYDADKIAVFGESAGGYLALMCTVTSDHEFNTVPFVGQSEDNNPSASVDVLIDYYGHTDFAGLDEDLRAIGLPRVVYSLANSWTFGKLEGFEDFSSYWLRKNVSEMTTDELDASNPHSYIDQNREEISKKSVWMIHGDCDITIPLPVSERLYAHLAAIMGEGNVRFRIEPNMGHGSDPLYSDDILAEIDSFIRSKLS